MEHLGINLLSIMNLLPYKSYLDLPATEGIDTSLATEAAIFVEVTEEPIVGTVLTLGYLILVTHLSLGLGFCKQI